MSEPAGSILIVYRGSPAALVGLRRLTFLGELRHRPPGEPDVRVVAYMTYYAQLVLAEQMPGPYADEDAERFARLALIDDAALVVHGSADDAELATRLRVPVEQIARTRAEAHAH